MGFEEIRKLKKVERDEKKSKHFPVIVLGENFFSKPVFNSLVNKFGEDAVKIIWQQHPDSDLEWKTQTTWPVLGEKSISVVETLAPECLVTEGERPASRFFKDGQFHSFGSRKKPEKLLFDEGEFVQKRCSYGPEKALPGLWDDVDARHIIKALVKSVRRPSETDLAEVRHWEVNCENGDVYTCDKLICLMPPKALLDLLESPDEFSDAFHQMCSNEHSWQSLQVCFELDRPWFDKDSTHFFPQSLTHEWGHFIGWPLSLAPESPGEDAQKRQKIVFFCYLPDSEMTEEDISKKIRLLKRVLERVFPQFQRSIVNEKIFLNPTFPSLHHDDELWSQCCDEFEHLFFVDAESPINKGSIEFLPAELELEEVHFFARALCGYHIMQNSLT